MSIIQIFETVKGPNYLNKNIDVLRIVDKFFVSHCGCIENTKFFNLIELPDDYFKIIIEYCIDKKYIIINEDFEYKLCLHLIRKHIHNDNIRIILWLIENFVSSDRLNSFRYDYNYGTDKIIENIEKYPQQFYCLLQPFYNNQFYDDTFIPMIFDTFRKKKFNFYEVSRTSSTSLICSALKNWDIYGINELHKEKCEFDEECYEILMNIVYESLNRLQYESDKKTQPKNHGDGSWSYVSNILYRKILEDHYMLITIFQPHFLNCNGDDNDEQNVKLIKLIEKYVDDKFTNIPNLNYIKKYMIEEVSSYYYRSRLVPNETRMTYIYDILKYCVETIKIDLEHKYSVKYHEEKNNLLDVYIYGSLPIRLIFPEWHQKFIKILTP